MIFGDLTRAFIATCFAPLLPKGDSDSWYFSPSRRDWGPGPLSVQGVGTYDLERWEINEGYRNFDSFLRQFDQSNIVNLLFETSEL